MRTLTPAARLASASIAAAAVAPAGYLGALTALSFRGHHCGASTSRRFAVVVPAHDEAEGIESTLHSLASIDYPSDRYEVVVIADNCVDDTADRARRSGVEVIERHDERRGKGYALDFAFAELLRREDIDAFAVIDADTEVDPDMLACAAFHLDHGASALQVDYRVRNPGLSWRTRLMDVAFTCSHRVRWSGRSAVHLSVGLRGNGMIFDRQTLELVPYQAFSVVEDLEYGIVLGQNGIVVETCISTFVAGDVPADSGSSASQRVRWELGRDEIRRKYGWSLVRSGVWHRRPVEADLGIDLLIPPLSTTVAAMVAATVGALTVRVPGPARQIVAAGWLALLGHVVVGVWRSPSSWRVFPALGRIPIYLGWKAAVRMSREWQEQAESGAIWTRTARTSAGARRLGRTDAA